MSKGMICFDMDGTIADLYGVDGWLEKLRAENPEPYVLAKPMWDMERLAAILNKLIDQGWEVRVISWLAKDASQEYNEVVRAAKKWWLHQYHFPYQKAHLVAYGTTKANTIRNAAQKGAAILIDDNAKIRKGWHMGETIDPTAENIIHRLEELAGEQPLGRWTDGRPCQAAIARSDATDPLYKPDFSLGRHTQKVEEGKERRDK